jgi:ADP-ribose pyrophosphatase YjhB (NUDIX family)
MRKACWPSSRLHETVTDGLRREVREETGLDVESVALTGVYKSMQRGIVALVFRGRVAGGNTTLSTGETVNLRWFTGGQSL